MQQEPQNNMSWKWYPSRKQNVLNTGKIRRDIQLQKLWPFPVRKMSPTFHIFLLTGLQLRWMLHCLLRFTRLGVSVSVEPWRVSWWSHVVYSKHTDWDATLKGRLCWWGTKRPKVDCRRRWALVRTVVQSLTCYTLTCDAVHRSSVSTRWIITPGCNTCGCTEHARTLSVSLSIQLTKQAQTSTISEQPNRRNGSAPAMTTTGYYRIVERKI